MYFDQKIKYLDYVEEGLRVRGAGFLRLECWGKTCNLILQASGLFEQPQGSYPVYLLGEGREECLGELFLQNGKGRLELRNLSCESLGAAPGMSAAEIEGIRIPLGESRQLVGILRERDVAENTQESTGESGGDAAATGTMQAEIREAAQLEKREGTTQEEMNEEAVQAHKREGTTQAEISGAGMEQTQVEPNVTRMDQDAQAAPVVERDEVQDAARREASFTRQANLRPGKWEQLLAIYPPITPFGDARRYLQISPGDFVILKDRSYRMVNNSFLLHGYFTYRHLILHRQNRRGEMVYYVGVPGRYYDREKEVAILFGFESFEGAEEPAREGDFGYYMMRVEL